MNIRSVKRISVRAVGRKTRRNYFGGVIVSLDMETVTDLTVTVETVIRVSHLGHTVHHVLDRLAQPRSLSGSSPDTADD